MCPSDTSPEAWRIYLDLVYRMTPEEKLRRTFELSEAVRALARAGMRERYPDATEQEIFLRVARLIVGPDLFRKAYGDVLPDEEPPHGRT